MTLPIPAPAALRLAAIACAVMGGLPAASPAFAQQDQRAQIRAPCAEDYKKHCAGVMPGGGAIMNCLMANADKLAPDCRSGVETWKKNKQGS